MTVETVTLELPEALYQRLIQNARATQRPIEEVALHAMQVGSPPAWDDVPAEYQSDLAVMDRLEDDALWKIAHSTWTPAEVARYDELLDMNEEGALTEAERVELTTLRQEADALMLRKAHAAALLRWRGRTVPIP